MCWQKSLRVEALLQTLQAKRFYFSMNIQMYFYQNPHSELLLTEIFESWSFITNWRPVHIYFIILFQFMLWRLFNIIILSCSVTEGLFTWILSSSCCNSCYEGFSTSWSCPVQSLKACSHLFHHLVSVHVMKAFQHHDLVLYSYWRPVHIHFIIILMQFMLSRQIKSWSCPVQSLKACLHLFLSSSCCSSCYEGFSTSWSCHVQALKACSHLSYHHLVAGHVMKVLQNHDLVLYSHWRPDHIKINVPLHKRS